MINDSILKKLCSDALFLYKQSEERQEAFSEYARLAFDDGETPYITGNSFGGFMQCLSIIDGDLANLLEQEVLGFTTTKKTTNDSIFLALKDGWS